MLDRIQNMPSLPCDTGACAPSATPREQTPAGRGSLPGDTVNISKQGRQRQARTTPTAADKPGQGELDYGQQREVAELKKTDQEVKAHERAHMGAGAGLVMGGANYRYQRGPDGKMYAVSGEVKIDTSREKNPKDTVTKMQQVKRAALAPSHPSSQDRSVAARASQIEAEARAEMLRENAEKTEGSAPDAEPSPGTIPAANSDAYHSSSRGSRLKIVV